MRVICQFWQFPQSSTLVFITVTSSPADDEWMMKKKRKKKSEESFSTWMWRVKAPHFEKAFLDDVFCYAKVLNRAKGLNRSWNSTTTLIGVSWKFYHQLVVEYFTTSKSFFHTCFIWSLIFWWFPAFTHDLSPGKISSQPTLFIKPLKPFNDNNDFSLFSRAQAYICTYITVFSHFASPPQRSLFKFFFNLYRS